MICRHPDVCAYIDHSLEGVQQWLHEGTLRRLVICVKTEGNAVLEQFVFSISRPLPRDDLPAASVASIEHYLSQFFVKISLSETRLDDIADENLTFGLLLYTEESTSVDAASLQWAPRAGARAQNAANDIVPLHSMESEAFALELFVECFQ